MQTKQSKLNNAPLLLTSFFPPVPPMVIGSNPESVNVVVNSFVSLSCEATGLPPPTLTWLNDRGPVQANTHALIMPGTASLEHTVDAFLKKPPSP